jgi:hypothetical protein
MTESEKNPDNEGRVWAELSSIRETLLEGPDAEEINEQVVMFVRKLRAEHGKDIEKYKLYHLIVGSTPDPEWSPQFDLPNGEIEEFIRNLTKK